MKVIQLQNNLFYERSNSFIFYSFFVKTDWKDLARSENVSVFHKCFSHNSIQMYKPYRLSTSLFEWHSLEITSYQMDKV